MSGTHNIKPRPSCDICGKTFRVRYNVTIHKRIHTGERPYKCERCERAFMYRSSYRAHMVSAHGIGNKKVVDGTENSDRMPGNQITINKRQGCFKCRHCGRTFMNLPNYNIHLATAHKSGEHKLDGDDRFDPERFDRRPGNHIARNKRQPDISLNSPNQISGTYFANNNRKSGIPTAINSRKLHMTIPGTIRTNATPNTNRHPNGSRYGKVPEESARFECRTCQRTFANNITLKSHMRMHEISKTSTNSGTKETDLINNNKNNNIPVHKINEHMFSISGQNIKDMVNAMMTSEKQHQTKDNGVILNRNAADNEVDTVRTICNSDNFEPELSQHNDITCETYKCEKCGETCINKDEFAAHKCRSKRCPKCYKPFKTWIGLKQHEALMHPKPYKYTCTVCGLSYKTPSDYTDHMKSHGGKRDGRQVYECSVCKSKLYTKKSFTKHKRLHKKFYQCKICNECFDTKEEQMKHSLDGHKRNRPYKCPYCELAFTVKFTRDYHVKLIHKSSVQLSLDNTPPKYDSRKSVAEVAVNPYTCTQCGSSFSQKYLLQKHVMKVHWKEDNKVNKMKEVSIKKMKEIKGTADVGQTNNDGKLMTVRPTKENIAAFTPVERGDTEAIRYACDTCGADFTTRTSLKRHIIAKHLDGPLHAKNEQENTHFSGKCAAKDAILIQPPLETGLTLTNAKSITNFAGSKKELNKAILREYYVPNSLLTSSLVDSDTDKELYVCKVCSTTYTQRASLWRHIKNRTYDHSSYLRERAPHAIPGFECDVCGETYIRRCDLFLHRIKHTKNELKDAGAREHVYKAPDRSEVMAHTDHTTVSNSDQVVSSSTTKGTSENQTNETDKDGVSIDMERGDDSDFEEVEEEPLYTARPYFPEKIKDYEFVENDNIYQTDHTQAVHDIQNLCRTIEGQYQVGCSEQNIEYKITANAQDLVEISDAPKGNNIPDEFYRGQHVNTTDKSYQMGTTEGINRTEKTHTGGNINTSYIHEQKKTLEGMNITGHISIGEHINNRINKEHASSATRVNTTVVQHINIHKEVNQNELPSMPKQYADTVATVTDCLTNVPSTVEDDVVCTNCRLAFLGEKQCLRCSLCYQVFCANCSGLPRGVFNVLSCTDEVIVSGIWWTCANCKDVVPKFTQLVKQLGDFDQIINNRLTGMEQKVSVLRPKGKN